MESFSDLGVEGRAAGTMPQLQPRRDTGMATGSRWSPHVVQCLWLALCEIDEEDGRKQSGRPGIELATKGRGLVIVGPTVTLLLAEGLVNLLY